MDINKILNYIEQDGLLHIILSSLIAAILSLFLPIWIAAIITFAIGLAKELVYDLWLKKGTCELKDLICDVVGIIIGIL